MACSLPHDSSAEKFSCPGAILAIDYGQKRLGLAVSDASCVTSRPFATWTRINRRRDLARLRELVRQQNIRSIVVGLPLHLDGTPSEMSQEASGFAARLRKALGIPVEMMDERLSSWEARQDSNEPLARAPHQPKKRGPGRHRQKHFDDAAAAIILRDYLSRSRAIPAGKD